MTLTNPTHQEFEYLKIAADYVSKASMKIISASGDVIHKNGGTNLEGVI